MKALSARRQGANDMCRGGAAAGGSRAASSATLRVRLSQLQQQRHCKQDGASSSGRPPWQCQPCACRRQQRSLPRAAAGGSSSLQPTDQDEEDVGYMREYAAMKAQLLDNTRKCGGAIGLYLLLTVNATATLCAMAGCAASYGYFTWLCYDVDNVKPTDPVPVWEANKIDNALLRRLAKLGAAYRAALRPRLLVLVGVAALIAAYNKAAPEPLPLVYEGCILGGFLSYKVALLVKLFDELSPKSYTEKKRPSLEKIEVEEELDLDMYGRPKKAVTQSPLAVMPEEERAKAEQQLVVQLEKEDRRAGRAPQQQGKLLRPEGEQQQQQQQQR